MGNGMWATYGLIAVFAVVPALLAYLGSWRPWEIVALLAVLAPATAIVAWAWAWRAVQVRRIELTALASDEQAARLLGESLGRCGTFLMGTASREIWDVFAALPSESKRAMALAITGFMADADSYETFGFGEKVAVIARGFRSPSASPAIATDEQAARAFGESLGRCDNHLDAKMTQELWDVFTTLPGEAKRGLASALVGFFSSADLEYGHAIGEKVLALAHSFRLAPELSPALTS